MFNNTKRTRKISDPFICFILRLYDGLFVKL
nr:MAG TPA: hypothetical protein [Caudoviricetes sp.]